MIKMLIFLLIQQVFAWNYETHFIIVRMAYDLLMERNPIIVEKVDEVIWSYSDYITVEDEDRWPMAECTVFADKIKMDGGGY